MLGDTEKIFATGQCSNNSVSDQIHTIPEHVMNLNKDMFTMQLDESTDVVVL